MPRGAKPSGDDETFEDTGSGAAEVVPKQCSALRKGEMCMIKDKPCKIVEMSTSKTGKHGHAKVHLVGIDIFDNKKLEDICPSTHNMKVPNVKTLNYQLLTIEDGFLQLLDDNGAQKEDLAVPAGDLGDEITTKYDEGKELTITVITACGKEKVMGYKTITT